MMLIMLTSFKKKQTVAKIIANYRFIMETNKLSTFASRMAQKASDWNTKARSTTENGVTDAVKSTADWIKKAADEAVKMLDTAREKIPKIPPIFLLCRIKYLPGMSAIALAANIIQELSKRGFIMEVNFDGTKNCIVEFVEVIAEKVVEHIKDCAKTSNIMETPAGPVLIEGKVD